MGFNTFGERRKTTSAPFQVWIEVSGRKTSGGTIDISDYPTGSVLRAGTPVGLSEAGGSLIPIVFYELTADVGSTDTELLLVGTGVITATGNIGVVPDEFGGETKGVAYTGGKDNGDGTFTIKITANALGELEEGTVLAKVNNATETAKLVNTAKPEGLLFHDIVVGEGDRLASGSVVDVGRIFEDRTVRVPDAYKAFMPSVKFEKGV